MNRSEFHTKFIELIILAALFVLIVFLIAGNGPVIINRASVIVFVGYSIYKYCLYLYDKYNKDIIDFFKNKNDKKEKS